MALWSLHAWDAQIQANVVTWSAWEVTHQMCDLAERWLGWDLKDAGSDLWDWAELKVQGPSSPLGWACRPQGYCPNRGGVHTHTLCPYNLCFPVSCFIYLTGNNMVGSHLSNSWGYLSCQVSLPFGRQFTFLCLLSRFHPFSKSVSGFFLNLFLNSFSTYSVDGW